MYARRESNIDVINLMYGKRKASYYNNDVYDTITSEEELSATSSQKEMMRREEIEKNISKVKKELMKVGEKIYQIKQPKLSQHKPILKTEKIEEKAYYRTTFSSIQSR